jgi:hypothetical protein
MEKLTRNDLYPLEQYARERSDFRARVIEHKKPRRVSVGPHLNLYFEDRLTMQYQIQEMLRVERIFEEEGIEEELNAYNPMIPDGDNWKATLMLEYDDVEQRKRELTRLIGIEDNVWVRVGEGEKIFAIADEDLERSNDDKTSAVHFLRFQLGTQDVAYARAGARISVGVDHENYRHVIDSLSEEQRASLAADLG